MTATGIRAVYITSTQDESDVSAIYNVSSRQSSIHPSILLSTHHLPIHPSSVITLVIYLPSFWVWQSLYQMSSSSACSSPETDVKLLYLTPEKFKNSPKMRSLLRNLYNKVCT